MIVLILKLFVSNSKIENAYKKIDPSAKMTEVTLNSVTNQRNILAYDKIQLPISTKGD